MQKTSDYSFYYLNGKIKKVPDFPDMKPHLVKIGNRENRKNRVGPPPKENGQFWTYASLVAHCG